MRPVAAGRAHRLSKPTLLPLGKSVLVAPKPVPISPAPPSLVVGRRLAMSFQVLANTQHNHHRRHSGLSWTSPVVAPKTGAFLQSTRNRTRDHLISAKVHSQMLYQLSYERCYRLLFRLQRCCYTCAGEVRCLPKFRSPGIEPGTI